jgi:RNA polymerase sigma-70 factor (ECF subfamily)
VDTLKKNKYNNEGKFLQWAMRIAYNLCVDHFRKSKKFCKVNPTETFDIFSVVSSNEDHMESMMIKDQTSSQIRQLIDMLPEEQREVIILRHYADMSFKEIAMMTRVSINTALGRMRYALINLRKYAKERQIALSES